ncbi:RAB9A protein, partial [Crocuta crocuta]
FISMKIGSKLTKRIQKPKNTVKRGADCCPLNFSVDDTQIFQDSGNQRKEFIHQLHVKDHKIFYFVIWGNKVNLSDCQESIGKAHAWCRDHSNYLYFEMKAKDIRNVTVTFKEAI